jgi:predicted alpha/beta superfamily hydrolase
MMSLAAESPSSCSSGSSDEFAAFLENEIEAEIEEEIEEDVELAEHRYSIQILKHHSFLG